MGQGNDTGPKPPLKCYQLPGSDLRVCTVGDVARAGGLTRQAVSDAVRHKRIGAVVIGRTPLIAESEARRYLATRSQRLAATLPKPPKPPKPAKPRKR